MKDIEWIEQYFSGQLDEASKSAFEARLKEDPDFAALKDEVQVTLDVLHRGWLKGQVVQARQQVFYKKILLTGIVIILVLLGGAYLFMTTAETKKLSHKTNVTSLQDTSTANHEELIMIVEDTSKQMHALSLILADSIIKNDTNHADVFSKPLPQIFIIDNTVDNVINCRGMTVRIGANSLCTQTGLKHLKKVRLSVTTFNDYYDLWQYDLHTCSEGKLLETGGACHIEATCEGQEVTVEKGKYFTIDFDSKPDKEMNTFYGSRDSLGNFDWQEDQQDFVKKLETSPRKTLNLKLYDTIYYLESIISDETHNVRSHSYRFGELSALSDLLKVFDTLTRIPSEDAEKLYYDAKSLLIRFGVNRNGRLTGYDYNFIVPKKIEKHLKEIASYIVANKSVEKKDLYFDNAIINVTLKPLVRVEEKDTAIFLDSNFEKTASHEEKKAVYNSIVCNMFGYINCDKFKASDVMKDVVIDAPWKDVGVKIFFGDFNAVANCTFEGGKARFRNAPKDARFLIVATVQQNGQSLMSVKEAKVGEDIKLRETEPLNLVKLRDKLLQWSEDN
jgi:hypothetical protein